MGIEPILNTLCVVDDHYKHFKEFEGENAAKFGRVYLHVIEMAIKYL